MKFLKLIPLLALLAASALAQTAVTRTSAGVVQYTGLTIPAPLITTSIRPATDDGAPLGDTTHNWSDLFMATGGVINFANGNWVATHTSGILTVGTGDLRVTTAGTNSASVVTVGGSQALIGKTYNGNTLTTGTYTLTGAAGKTLTFSNTLTLAGTDGTTMTFPGTSATIARTDAANTFTGTQTLESTTSLLLGTAGSAVGNIGFRNATSGTITLAPATGALGTVTQTLQAVAGTIYSTGGTDVAVADGGTGLSSGTSGGVLAFTASGTLASSGALAANALVIGGGAGVAPSTTTTGSGVLTALAIAPNATGGLVTAGGPVRITAITSSATPTYNTDSCDVVNITALAAAITSMTSSRTGTLADFQQVEFRIKDDGTARAITWGADFSSGIATLPTTTILGKTLYVYCEFDAVTGDLMCQATGSYP